MKLLAARNLSEHHRHTLKVYKLDRQEFKPDGEIQYQRVLSAATVLLKRLKSNLSKICKYTMASTTSLATSLILDRGLLHKT